MTADAATTRVAASDLSPRWWWGFLPYVAVSIVHVTALLSGWDAVSGPTKLALMPLLAVAVLWGGRGSQWGAPYTLMFVALALSWLGDGAATGSVAKIVKLEHAWRRLDGRNDDGFQVAPFPG